MGPDEKKCPFCAETIKAEAIKCRYCGSELADTVPSETPSPIEQTERTPVTQPQQVPEQIPASTPNRPVGELASELGKKAGVVLVAGGKAARLRSKRLVRRIEEWWKSPKFRKGWYITAGVVAFLIAGLIIIAVVTHQTPEEAATSKAITEAKTFLRYASNKKYEAMLPYIDKSSYPLLKAELCQALTRGAPADVLGYDDTTFGKMLIDSAFPSFFEPSVWKSLEVAGGKKIADKTYAIVLKNPRKTNEGTTLIVKRTDQGSYSIDMAGLPPILGGINQGKDNRNAAEYIADSVNELITKHTKESCSTAVVWLAMSDGLENRYGLLVSDKYRDYVASTGIKVTQKNTWEKAKDLAAKFPDLAEKAETEMDNFRTADDYIIVTGPTEGQQFTVGLTATVQGTVKDECSLTLNGQSVGIGNTDKKFAPVVTVVEGANRLSLVVTNKRGKTYNKDITIVGIQPAPPSPAPTPYNPPSPAPTPYNPPTISLDEFNAIQDGMTYEQVVAIVGGAGTVLSESGSPGSEYYTVMYTWEGEGSIGANANCMFQGGRLVSKAQFGLE